MRGNGKNIISDTERRVCLKHAHDDLPKRLRQYIYETGYLQSENKTRILIHRARDQPVG